MAALVSKKQPTMSSSTLSISRNWICPMPPKASVTAAGSCAMVAAWENTVLPAMSRKTWAVVRPASLKMGSSCLNLMSRVPKTATMKE